MKPKWRLLRSAVSVGAPALAFVAAANLLIRMLAIDVGDVPADLQPLAGRDFLMGTVAPVVGNTGGFFAAYRDAYRDGVEPSRKHHLLFLLPGAAFFCFGMTRGMLSLPDGASTMSVFAAIIVNIVPTAVIIPALHRLGHPETAGSPA